MLSHGPVITTRRRCTPSMAQWNVSKLSVRTTVMVPVNAGGVVVVRSAGEHCDIRLVRPMRRAGPVSREVVGDDSGVSSDAH